MASKPMTNAPEDPLSKVIGVVLLALCLVFSTLALAVSSLFIFSFWHIYWIFPEEGWQLPLFLTGLWFASAGALAISALVSLSRRSLLHISMAITLMICGLIAVAGSYVEPTKPNDTSLNAPEVYT